MTRAKRVKTSPLLQMEAVECGAAALGIICAYHGLNLPLEQLRMDCGVGRDGTNAKNILTAARSYGLEGKAYRRNARSSLELPLPFIAFWEYNHFLVVEGFDEKRVYLNDPALGKTWVSQEEFAASYSGVSFTFTPGAAFKKGGSSFQTVKAVRDVFGGSHRTVAFLLFISLLALLPALVIPTITRVFFDFILIQKNTFWLVPVMVSLALAIVISIVIMSIQNVITRKLHMKLSTVLSYKLMVKIFHLPLSFYLQRSKAEVASRVEYANIVAESVTGTLLTAFFSIFSSLFFLVVMFAYNVRLTLVCFLLAALSIYIFLRISKRGGTGHSRLVKDTAKLSGITYSGLQSIESIKSSGRESEFFEKWTGFHAKYLAARQETGFYAAVNKAVPSLLSIVNMAVILLYGGYEVMKGGITVGMLVSFTVFFQYFFSPVQKLIELGSEFQLLNSYFRSLYDILNYPVEEPALLSAVPGEKLQGRIDIHNISFGYNRTSQPVLKDVSLSIATGESAAFVGLSGSGKTTLAKLITGLYQPWDGHILFDDQDLHRLPKSLRTGSIGVIDQEMELFEGTVRDVLTFWDEQVLLEDVIQACKIAEIHDVISERKGGYFSRVDEGGKNFSGGQRQRLEIARALIKKPSILIMDEATSALDPETEYRICENIKALGVTLIIIAHRLSTIRECDRIYVLNGGIIEASGRHADLLEESPLYHDFLKNAN
jgi:ATP-binding cassette, subfamily C, bacterial